MVLSNVFLSHSTNTFRTGTLLCFGKFPVSKKITEKSGMSPFSVENFLLHSTENFVGEPFRVSLITDLGKLYA